MDYPSAVSLHEPVLSGIIAEASGLLEGKRRGLRCGGSVQDGRGVPGLLHRDRPAPFRSRSGPVWSTADWGFAFAYVRLDGSGEWLVAAEAPGSIAAACHSGSSTAQCAALRSCQ